MAEYYLTCLVVGKYQSIRNHNILSPSSIEDNDFGNVVRRQWLASFVYSVGSFFVTIKANNGELLHVVRYNSYL